MNYIDLINSFWRFYDENKSKLNVSDIILYKVLLRYCNKVGWINPFTVNPYLMAEINPLSINTYYKSFKKLNDLKLIVWVKGKYNVNNQSVTIINITNSINTSVNNSIDNSIKFSTTNSIVNNNKTIIQLDNKTIKLLKKDDFYFLIKSTEFKNYLNNENLELIKKIEPKKYPDFFNENLIKTYLEFKTFRTEKKKTITETQEPRFLEKLEKLSKGQPKIAEKILIQSIENGWQGIFELKDNGEQERKPPELKKIILLDDDRN